MKRLTVIVVSLFCVLGASLWVLQSFVSAWEPRLRAALERRAGSALQARVQIDRLSIAFLHRIRLHQVQVRDAQPPSPLLFRASDISITLSLIDLPRAILRRQPLEAIGLVSLHAPWVQTSTAFLQDRAAKSRPEAWPLLFTLAWDHGTFQWKDPSAPGGAWTLYKAKGAFRIRGPRAAFDVQGALDAAQTIRVQGSRLGNRWNAQASILNGDLPATLELARRLAPKPLWPAGWASEGRYDLELRLAGRRFPSRGESPLPYLESGRLRLTDVQVRPRPAAPAIRIQGAVVADRSRLSASGLTLLISSNPIRIDGSLAPLGPSAQWDVQAQARHLDLAALTKQAGWPDLLQGHGDAQLNLSGPLQNPILTLQAKIPSGELARRTFRDGRLHWRYASRRLEFLENEFQFLDGRFNVKGALSPEENDLSITGENLALARLLPETWSGAADGRLHFSCSFRGPPADWRATGSFWVNNFAWGPSAPSHLKGDLDATPQRFRAQAVSEDAKTRLAIEGSRKGQETTVDRFEIHLPQGASLTGQAKVDSEGRLKGSLDAEKINLAADVSALRRWAPTLQGLAEIHARLMGTLRRPALQGELAGRKLQLGAIPLGDASASFVLKPRYASLPRFKLEPGIEGAWNYASDAAPVWNLELALADAPAASLGAFLTPKTAWPGFLSGQLRLRPGSLEFQKLSWVSPSAIARLEGRASWDPPPGGRPVSTVRFHAKGEARSAREETLWRAPLEARGEIHPADHWEGQADLHVPTIHVRGQAADPARAHLAWNRQSIRWTNAAWGDQWASNGSLQFGKDSPSISARLQARKVPLAQWQQWLLGSKSADPIDGLFSGACSWQGSLDHPTAEFSGSVKEARWRAFRFRSDWRGQWVVDGQRPLTIDATAQSDGGQLHFQGGYDPADRQVQGAVSLNQLDLRPLGQSLSFPKDLDGKADGTFTVRGPLNRLSFTGHLEGGPVAYGPDAPNPFRLETYAVDLTLAPSPEQPETMRLTVTEGLAKTKEEQIRLNPGSFIDLAGAREAKAQAGLEIRNLHLGVFTLFGGVDLYGTWQIRPKGFAVRGGLYTRSLFINDYELEEGHVNADYYDRVLRFHPLPQGPSMITGSVDFRQAPQLRFTDFSISGTDHRGFRMTGDIGPSLWDFRMAGRGLDLGTLGGLAGFPYSLNGTADGTIRGTGDSAHPHVEGSVDLKRGSVLGLSFENGSSAFVWQDDRMTFTRLLLSDPGRYTLSGAGVFPVTSKEKRGRPDRTIDFSVRLQDSNLGLLQSLSREVKKAKGPVQALIQVTGTADQPRWRGSLRVSDGEITGAHYFRHLRDFNMAADFEGNDWVIREMRGKSGDGEFQIGGKIAFAGLQPRAYDLRAQTISRKGLQVQVPELAIPESPLAKRFHFLTTASYGDVKGRVTFKGPAEAPEFQGEAVISNGHFSFPPPLKHPPPPALLEWFRRIAWDVNLRFQDGAWFENELVEANLTGDLRLQGPSERLRVDGGMDIAEGQISYLGVDFSIRQARFDIRSSSGGAGVINTPYVRGIAESQTRSIDPASRLEIHDTITLTIDHAPLDQIKPRLVSAGHPTLSQEKLLARVAQLDTGNLSPQERNYLYQQQMVRLIDASLATPLAKRLLKPTGLVDTVKVSRVIDPTQAPPADAAGAAGQPPSRLGLLANTKYTFEKHLSDRLALGYGVRFVEETAPATLQNKLDLVSDVELSYRWFRNVYVRGSFELPNAGNPAFQPERRLTIEPRWRFGWWGNTNKEKPSQPAP